MEQEKSKHKDHGYGIYVMVWLGLIALTSITVSIAGMNFGELALTIAMLIAAIKSSLVINYFMHIKYEEPIFKVFLVLSGMTLFIIFVLTFSDLVYR